MSYYLAIVSPLDAPLLEVAFQSTKPGATPASANFPTWSTFTSATGGDLGAPDGRVIGGNLGLVSTGGVGAAGGVGERHLLQMIVHKSLDGVEEVMEGTGSL